MAAEFPKSRKSGGQTTRVGRALALRNSLKHGAYATQEFLPEEDHQ